MLSGGAGDSIELTAEDINRALHMPACELALERPGHAAPLS